MQRDLTPLFFPRSVAVIGASERPTSLTGAIVRNLAAGGYPGAAYVVHPTVTTVHGVRAYPDLDALPEVPELAVVGVAPDNAERTIDHLLARGTRAFILVTAGFGELSTEGRDRERALAARCRERGAVMMGSNCMGLHVITAERRLDASFSRLNPKPGRIALLCQSGSIGEFLFLRMVERRLGVALFASLGNMADLDVPDLLTGVAELLPDVDQVLLYLESVPDAARLRRAAAKLGPGVRLLVVRGGTTGSGMRAVGGHTGAVAPEPRLAEALLRGVGAEEVTTLTEAVDLMEAVDRLGPPRGKRVVVVTNAGGPAVLATDELGRGGVDLPEPSAQLRRQLAAELPPAAVTGNPVDLLASAGPEAYRHALELLTRSPEYDAILPVFMHPIVTDAAEVARVFRDTLAGAPVPALPCFMPAPEAAASTDIIREAGLPVLAEPNRAARALARWAQPAVRSGASWPPSEAGRRLWPTPAPRLGGSAWGDPETLEVFVEGPGVSRPPGVRVPSRTEAERAARELGVPLALKIERGSDPHKKKAGLLALARDEHALAEALDSLAARSRDGDRWLVQRLVPRGVEVFASFLRHPDLGCFVGVGRGGSAVERGEPPRWLALPALASRAEDLFAGSYLLRELGDPGEPAAQAVRALVEGLAALATEAPEVQVAEVNPAIWDPDAGVLWLVDVRWQAREAV